MGRYILKRLGQTAVVILILSFLVFMLVSMLPGDPVYAMLGGEISQETYQRWYQALNLDKPIIVRYFLWLWDAIRLDFGVSASYHMPVVDVLAERIPTTLYFSLLSFVISIPIGILLGILSAIHRGKKTDTIVTMTANITCCLPQFWLSVLFLYIFSMKLGWLPAFGFTSPTVDFVKSMKQTIMPLTCLTLGGIASIARQTRSSMLEVIRQDYVRTARSKGLAEKRVVYLHALKNALIPVITLMGLRLGMLIGGSVFVESVFNIPGVGTLFVKGIQAQDIPLIQACVLMIAFVSSAVNVITDIVYAVVDPRIRLD
ncbi:ABC transporter permease [Clostridium sp. KNHs205]|jgi:peptide/nickel transport system permease protein|uniref:ABC transporter permease n=1 Tax=Clostridium sp. KNHs205 TaxID=1449050 RepID=UPI00051C88DD|nr:ABC transporter permease [Clostridium sp. KNHs205]